MLSFFGSSLSVVLKIPVVTMYVTIKFPLVPLGVIDVTKKCKMTPSVYIIFQKIVPLSKFLKVAPKHFILICSTMFKKTNPPVFIYRYKDLVPHFSTHVSLYNITCAI